MNPLKVHDIKSKAILLHTDRRNSRFDLTVHDVIHVDGPEGCVVSQLGAGRVLGVEEKAEMGSIFNGTTAASLTLFDEHILSVNPYALVWWMPAAKRQLIFRIKDDTDTIREISIDVDFPSHVGVFCRGELYFAAVKANKARPKASTELFNSPLPNLYSAGRFCRGSAGVNIPREAQLKNIPAFESFLFDTVNTHMGSARPLKNIDSSEELISLYQEKSKVPRDLLVPMGVKLAEWLKIIDEQRVGN